MAGSAILVFHILKTFYEGYKEKVLLPYPVDLHDMFAKEQDPKIGKPLE